MVLPAWPVFFPLPQRAGNARSPVDLAARSMIATGLPVARQRFTRVRETAPVSFVLTADQLAAFDAWWHFTMGQGCGWFLITLKGELEEALHAARLSGGYQADMLGGGRWKVTASVELDDPPHLSADDYAGMILEGALPLSGPALSLHTLVHVSIPVRVLP